MSSFRERVDEIKRQLEEDIPDLKYFRGIYIDNEKMRWNQRSRFVVSFHVAGRNSDLYAKRGTLPYRTPVDETLTAASEFFGQGFETTPIVFSQRAIVQLERESKLSELFSDVDMRIEAIINDHEAFRVTGRQFNY